MINTMEEWKLIHEIKSNSKTHLKGDKYYISNEGRVKLNDIILDYGTGLYVSGKELRVYGCKLSEKTFHRTVYKLFIGEVYSGIIYNIHHIDGNHINNKASNLIQVTAKQHAKLHDEMYKNGEYKTLLQYNKNIKEIESNKKQLREQAKLFLIEYTNKRLDIIKEENKRLKELEKENKLKQKELQKQLDKDAKLKNGWKIDAKGRIYNPEVKQFMVLYRTKESYKQMGQKIKQLFIDNPDYKKSVCKNRNKISITNGTSIKYIDKEDVDNYLKEGWVKGRKIK